jgi:hypothetical protein
MPAFVLAAGATAWAISRMGRLRIPAEALLVLAVLLGATDMPASARWVAGGTVAAGGLGLLMALARQPRMAALVRRPEAAIALGISIAITLAAIGAWQLRRYEDLGRGTTDPAISTVYDRAPEGTRIGLAGNALASGATVAPLFGERFDNEVEWVGPVQRDQLGNYSDEESFVAALERNEYDLLVVFRGARPIWETGEAGFTGEEIASSLPPERWAREAGFRPIARGDATTLLARELLASALG